MIESTLNQFFRPKFEAGFLLVTTKLIKLASDSIKNFEINQKEIKLVQIQSKKIENNKIFFD